MVKNEASNIKGTNVLSSLGQSQPEVELGPEPEPAGSTGSGTAAYRRRSISSTHSGTAITNAGFVSFSAHDWHGLTARSNFTWGKSLGTGSVVQASSSITVPDPYNFKTFGTYGVQPFDVKYTYSLLMFYQPPIFRARKASSDASWVDGQLRRCSRPARACHCGCRHPLMAKTSGKSTPGRRRTTNRRQDRRLSPAETAPITTVQTTGLCAGTSGPPA